MTKKTSTKALALRTLIGVSALSSSNALSLTALSSQNASALDTSSSQITRSSAHFGNMGKRNTSNALDHESEDQYFETLIRGQKKYNSTLQDKDNEAKDTSILSRLFSWISPITTEHLNNQQLSSDAVDYVQSHGTEKHDNKDLYSGIESVRNLFENLRSNENPNSEIKSEDNDGHNNKNLTQYENVENKVDNHNFSLDVNNNRTSTSPLELISDYCKYGFESPIQYKEYNFSAQIFSQSKLQYSQVQKLDEVMKKAIEKWYKTYSTNSNPPECNIKMFVFDDSDTYRHFNQKNQICNHDVGGCFILFGVDNPTGADKLILVYNSGFTAHEIIHGIEHCNSNDLTKLSEGRAQYIEMQQNPSLEAHIMNEAAKFIRQETQDCIKEISESCYDRAFGKNPILCAAVEEYLVEDKRINSFTTILKDPVNGPGELANEVNPEELLKYVERKFLEASMKEINALPVKCGRELYTLTEKYDGADAKVTMYDAFIQAEGHKAPLPNLAVTLDHKHIRVILNNGNKYIIDVDMSYKNMMLTLHKGNPALVFCNESGQKFSDTNIYKWRTRGIDNDSELTSEQKEIIKDYLTYLPAGNIKQYPNGTIFETRLPTTDENAVKYKVSLFHNNVKVEELNSVQVYCGSVNGGAKTMLFDDRVNDISYAENEDEYPSYLAVVNGKIFLLSGIPTTDEFNDQRHVHYHPDFLIPAKGIFNSDSALKEVTLKNAILMNDGDSQIAIDKTNNLADNIIIIRRGKKLDDRGSNSTHDDRHEAVLTKQKGGHEKALHTTSYDLIGSSKDDGSFKHKKLVINKHAPTKVIQFPGEVDSIMKYNNTAFIPSTHDGRTNVTGMPKASANDMIIPSDDILTFKHPEHQPYTVEETGISDLSNYPDGTIFHIKSKEHCIPDSSCGAPAVISDPKTGEEIGVLRGSYQLYVGSTFQNINQNGAPGRQVHQQANSAQVIQLSENTFEHQHSKTALTNSKPGKIILNGKGFSEHDNTVPHDNATDVSHDDLNISNRVKRSISEDRGDSFSDGQEHFDLEYNDNQSNLTGDLHDSDIWHDAIS